MYKLSYVSKEEKRIVKTKDMELGQIGRIIEKGSYYNHFVLRLYNGKTVSLSGLFVMECIYEVELLSPGDRVILEI